MRNYTAQLPGVLRGSFDSRWVMDVFYDGERVMADVPVYDVSQNEDGTAKVQQSGSLTMMWADAFGESIAPRNIEDILSPFGTTITLYMMVTTGPLFTERVSMGSFVITDTPDIRTARWRWFARSRSKGDRIKLTFKDPFYKVQRNRFDVPGVTPSLTSVYAEIQRLTGLAVTRAPDVPDGAIPRALVYEEDRLDAIYELAGILDATPYMTADGTLSLRPKTWGNVVDTIAAEDVDPREVDTVAAAYSAWTEQRRNYHPNPRAVGSPGGGFGAGTLGAVSWVTDMPGDIKTARRWARNAAGAARAHDIQVGTTMPAAGQQVRVRLRLRASEAMSVQVLLRPAVASSTSQVALGTIAVPAGVSEIDLVGPSFTVATSSTSGVALVTSSGALAATLDVTAVDIGLAPGGERFDGWTPGTLLVRHRFVGAQNNSASVRETRQVLTPERTIPRPRPRGTLIGVSRGMSAEGVYNRVVVRAQGQQAGVLAAGEISDGVLRAQNPDGTDSPFGRVPYFMSSQYVTDPTQAREVVLANLPRLARPQAVVITVEEIVNPLREVGDVVRVQRQGESFLGRVVSVQRSSGKTQTTGVVLQDA